MNLHSKGSYLLGAVALTGLLAGCAADNPWGTESDSKGKIHLSLQTDGEVKDVKPIFRSGEKTAHIVPEAEDFSIRVEKLDGSMTKNYPTLADFKKEDGFSAGSYKVEAYYGDLETEGIDKAYYAGETTVQVLADRSSDAAITATLKNTEIQVNYTENFRNYFDDWTAKLHTEGYSYVEIPKGDNSIAYLAPGDTKVGLTFKTKDQEEASVYTAEFQTLAKQRYNVTFDFAGGEVGTLSKGQIEIIFDDGLTAETVTIDLTEELFVSAAPSVSLTGNGENSSPIEIVKGNAPAEDVKFNILCAAGLTEANFTVTSSAYEPAWGKEANLCKANAALQAQLAEAKVKCIGLFNNPDQMAVVDITEYLTTLPIGDYTITMMAVDNLGRNSDPISVAVEVAPVKITVANAAASFEESNGQAEVTLDFEGAINVNDLEFYGIDMTNNWSKMAVVGTPVETTRASETHTYKFKLQLLETYLKVSTTTVPIIVKLNEEEVSKFDIPVIIPKDYEVEMDAYSYHVLLKINPANDSDLADLVNNLKFKVGSADATVAARNTESGIITITGLSPKKKYSVNSSINGVIWREHRNFTTEDGTSIKNGDFSDVAAGDINSGTNLLQVGGQYNVTANYTLKSSFKYDAPLEWATLNSLTAYSGSSNWNTWFVVPSTWVEGGKAIVRSVGYNHNGTTPSKSGGAFNTKYYCENAPSASQLTNAAGELFLGSYSYTGTESRTNGIAFTSRPSKFTFDYEYTPVNSDDKGYAEIYLYDQSGNALVSKKELLSGSGTMTVDCSYGFGTSAAKLFIGFKSSNQNNAPINIPSGSALNEHQSLGNHTLDANSYHALATGSVLKIDNVKAHYEYEPMESGAPKRATTKKTKK